MKPWPLFPIIYEINTRVWLNGLRKKHQKPLHLGTIPKEEWEALASLPIDAVWFMGVWERSPAGIAISQRDENLQNDFRRALPDFTPNDNIGSAYCVRQYVVDDDLGGPIGLATAREILAKHHIRLFLDFVPNHVATDHPWAAKHPEYFIQGTDEDLRNEPHSYHATQGKIFACGRDPYFPAWEDVLQINAFQPDLRNAVIETLLQIADQCDGVRCDMAMLVINEIFENTWKTRAGSRPAKEYWETMIPAVHARYPEFQFMAEAYWDKEWQLQQQGFDFCYDKRLYDRMVHENAASIEQHLCSGMDYQRRLVRFLENHDEPRAAATFSSEKARAAAVILLTLPGAKLLYEGQFEGRKVRVPVFLRRQPDEILDDRLLAFYRTLLDKIPRDVFRNGQWKQCHCDGWPDNPSHQNIVAWSWEMNDERYLISVNFSDRPSQGIVRLPWEDLDGQSWQFTEMLSTEFYERSGNEILESGLFVSLEAWHGHFFQMKRSGTLY